MTFERLLRLLLFLGTVLLGQLLHAAATMLPHEIAATSHCLPQLAEHIKSDHNVSSAESNRAAAAVSALQRLHCIKKRRLVPHSLLLEQVCTCPSNHVTMSFLSPCYSS